MERLFGTLGVPPDILGKGNRIIKTHKMSQYLISQSIINNRI